MSQTIPFETLEKEWKKNPDYVQEYENLRPEFEMARELIHARLNDPPPPPQEWPLLRHWRVLAVR